MILKHKNSYKFAKQFLSSIIVWISFCLCSLSTAAQEAPDSLSTTPRFKIGYWGEFYNESTSFRQIGDNFISSSQSRTGLWLTGIPKMTLKLYGFGRYGRDLHKDFWNNKAELGIGLRLRFTLKVFFAVYLDWVKGYYLKVPDGYPQADNDRFDDLRAGLIFWYGWNPPMTQNNFLEFPFKILGGYL